MMLGKAFETLVYVCEFFNCEKKKKKSKWMYVINQSRNISCSCPRLILIQLFTHILLVEFKFNL